MCFVWLPQGSENTSSNRLKRLVFITATECVYCAVRTGCLCVIQVKFSLETVKPLQSFRKTAEDNKLLITKT
jgi:hypothetical protein